MQDELELIDERTEAVNARWEAAMNRFTLCIERLPWHAEHFVRRVCRSASSPEDRARPCPSHPRQTPVPKHHGQLRRGIAFAIDRVFLTPVRATELTERPAPLEHSTGSCSVMERLDAPQP
jgi:hypothetical protein